MLIFFFSPSNSFKLDFHPNRYSDKFNAPLMLKLTCASDVCLSGSVCVSGARLFCRCTLAGCSFPFRNQLLSQVLNRTRSQPLRRKLITLPSLSPRIFSTLGRSHSSAVSFKPFPVHQDFLQTLFCSQNPGFNV